MAGFDFNELAVKLYNVLSLISLILIILFGMGKQFESAALLWIRAIRRISEARKKK